MLELLCIPAWKNSPRPLTEWLSAFEELGHPIEVEPDGSDGAALSLETLSAEGYAELASDGLVSALHLEVKPEDIDPARPVVEQVALGLGYELHLDTDDDDDIEDD